MRYHVVCAAWIIVAALSAPAVRSAPDQQLRAVKPWLGDFDQMRERRVVRVLVPPSPTLYFNHKGKERGITAELVRETGQSMKVGDVTVIEPNIHAGTKYMNTIMTRYFQDAKFDDLNRVLFAFASYNAGPNRISKLRPVAASRGLNPDIWFDNVEIVVSEKFGRETTTYVRNIVKYYVAYKLMMGLEEEQRKAREALMPDGG